MKIKESIHKCTRIIHTCASTVTWLGIFWVCKACLYSLSKWRSISFQGSNVSYLSHLLLLSGTEPLPLCPPNGSQARLLALSLLVCVLICLLACYGLQVFIENSKEAPRSRFWNHFFPLLYHYWTPSSTLYK